MDPNSITEVFLINALRTKKLWNYGIYLMPLQMLCCRCGCCCCWPCDHHDRLLISNRGMIDGSTEPAHFALKHQSDRLVCRRRNMKSPGRGVNHATGQQTERVVDQSSPNGSPFRCLNNQCTSARDQISFGEIGFCEIEPKRDRPRLDVVRNVANNCCKHAFCDVLIFYEFFRFLLQFLAGICLWSMIMSRTRP